MLDNTIRKKEKEKKKSKQKIGRHKSMLPLHKGYVVHPPLQMLSELASQRSFVYHVYIMEEMRYVEK